MLAFCLRVWNGLFAEDISLLRSITDCSTEHIDSSPTKEEGELHSSYASLCNTLVVVICGGFILTRLKLKTFSKLIFQVPYNVYIQCQSIDSYIK